MNLGESVSKIVATTCEGMSAFHSQVLDDVLMWECV